MRPRDEALRCISDWTIEGGPVESFRGVQGTESFRSTELKLKEPFVSGAGDASGERDGKETRDFAEFGVTSDCFRDLTRTVPGRCEFETVEDFRSGRGSGSLAMTKGA